MKRTHFLSVLGTGLYEPVAYGFQGESGAAEQEFVQIALMECFAGQLKDNGRATILLTDRARLLNWEDRLYKEKDVERAGQWTSEKKHQVRENETKIGLRAALEKHYPELYGVTEAVSIPDAGTEDEIWGVFEAIYDAIEEKDEIIFDITHGFRSIPMLAMTIINYAKVMKKCTLKGIYYGAHEAGKVRGGVKYVPIMDLTVYNEILEWTNAAEAFIQYGMAAKMQEVYKRKTDSIAEDKKKEWEPIRRKVDAMQDLSMAIFTCRGTDMDELAKKDKNKAKKSVKNAYAAFMQHDTEASKNKARDIKPLYPLLEKIGDSYKAYFEGKDNVGTGLGMVVWSIDNGMIPQGYTALEETMITYLCKYYGVPSLTERTRDRIVSKTITEILSKYRGSMTAFEQDRECAAQELLEDKFQSMEEMDKETIKKILLTIPTAFVKCCGTVKQRRNDINHCGFRNAPARSDELGQHLKDDYDEFVRIKKVMDEKKAFGGTGGKSNSDV